MAAVTQIITLKGNRKTILSILRETRKELNELKSGVDI